MYKITLPALCAMLLPLSVFTGCSGVVGAQPTASSTTTTSNPSPNPTPNPSQPSTTTNSFNNVQAGSGWNGYALLPPSYNICNTCQPTDTGASWGTQQNIASPSLSGQAMRFDIGGTTPFADILWNVKFTSSLKDQKSVPDYHQFTYDVYFYGTNLETSQALEFDINQFVNNQSFIWGHECRIASGHEWDSWNNQTMHWYKTGIPCNPKSDAWNHLVIQAERTTDNRLHFISITLNGVTSTEDRYDTPTATTWYGMTINYQMDGNSQQQPYSVYLDNLNFSYQ